MRAPATVRLLQILLARGPARFDILLARGSARFDVLLARVLARFDLLARRGFARARTCVLGPAVGLAFTLLFCACAGHAAHTVEARKALDRHDPKTAMALYNKQLEVTSGSELPKKVSGDNAVLLLDRSMISQELEAYQDASRDLEIADKQVEMLDYSRSTADEIGRYLFSDNVGPYKARPFEKLLVNTMNMVDYLVRGDLSGAKIEARRLAVMQKYLGGSEEDPTAALLGPGSYFAGFTFEMARDFDEALHYYDEALRFAPYATLQPAIQHSAVFSGYRSPRLKPIVEAGLKERPKGTGELLVIVGFGRVPALHAKRVPIGLALSMASMFLSPMYNQSAARMAGQGLVTWVNYPELEAAPRNYALPVVQVDGSMLGLDTVTDVEALVRAAYDKQKGQMLAAAIIRMVVRGAVGAGVGVGVARASNSSAFGMLAAMATQATMVAIDTPDTRSWATLPARIALARVTLPVGNHVIRTSAHGVMREHTVEIRESSFAVVNLTELSQQ
jgi:tetratricopeptide (TPR) repeat protein